VRDLVAIAKAFADLTRVRILAAVRHRELCVCELCDALGVTQSTLSTHLQVIRDAGLVQTRKRQMGLLRSQPKDGAATRIGVSLLCLFVQRGRNGSPG